MINRFIEFAVMKIAGLRRRREKKEAVSFTMRETPELFSAYEEFSKNAQSGSPRQPFKGWELWHLLEKHQPRSIAEMGSGTTSAVFSLWAKKNGARYTCYEHHADWAAVTEHCLRGVKLIEKDSPVHHVSARVKQDRTATGFVEPIPADVDFIYVDGPPCKLEDGSKVPNDDVVRYLDNGCLPRTIVVDGRLETCDLIHEHTGAKYYNFTPSLVYCLRRGLYFNALTAPEHSVFSKS